MDHRSDIFSLGAILYEMLSGQSAFKRATASDTIAAILMQEPPELMRVGGKRPAGPRPDHQALPGEESGESIPVRQGNRVCAFGTVRTARGRGERPARRPPPGSPRGRRGRSLFPRGDRAARRRRRPPPSADPATFGSAGVPVPSIAVLPFSNLSGQGRGVLLRRPLGGAAEPAGEDPGLQVTARTSSFSFKGKGIAIPEIARQLHVTHVLEGSVRKAGNALRITAQLIDASTDKHVWSETYDRKLDDVFAIQDEIAADVVRQLRVKIPGVAPRARQTDPEAYALYLQAVQLERGSEPRRASRRGTRCCAGRSRSIPNTHRRGRAVANLVNESPRRAVQGPGVPRGSRGGDEGDRDRSGIRARPRRASAASPSSKTTFRPPRGTSNGRSRSIPRISSSSATAPRC